MEIYVGSTNPVRHKIFWQGEPTDADSNPSVSIYDVSNDPVFPTSPTSPLYPALTAEKVETEIGVYKVVLPVNATYKTRDLKLVWNYTVNGNSQVREHKLYVVTPYIDLSQAYESLFFGNDPSDPNYKTYDQIVAAERYARKTIENYTGQRFYTYTDSYSVYGTDSNSLVLPGKIDTLYKLYVNDQLLMDNINNINYWSRQVDISESGFAIRVNQASVLDSTVYTANGMVPPSIHDDNGVFRRGSRYAVFGKFGYSEVPDEVELATVELMKDYYAKDNMWRNKYVNKISTFDWDFEYSSGATSGTGNLYADQLLSDYVISKVMLI